MMCGKMLRRLQRGAKALCRCDRNPQRSPIDANCLFPWEKCVLRCARRLHGTVFLRGI
jgi:hypothetical protein